MNNICESCDKCYAHGHFRRCGIDNEAIIIKHTAKLNNKIMDLLRHYIENDCPKLDKVIVTIKIDRSLAGVPKDNRRSELRFYGEDEVKT